MKHASKIVFTPDQFEKNWQHIDRLRRRARVMRVIAQFGGFLTNLFFLFSVFFFVNGLLFRNFHGSYHSFLSTIPWFLKLWNPLAQAIFLPADPISIQIRTVLLCSYGASVCLFALLALIIALLYHPRKAKPAGGTDAELAAQMAKLARDAWSQSYKTRINTSIGATILVIISAFLLFFAYTVYLDDPQAAAMLLCIFPTSEYTTNCMLYVFFAYLLSSMLSTVLLTLTRPFYRYQFPQDLMVRSQQAHLLLIHELVTEEAQHTWAEALCRDAILTEQEGSFSKAMPMFYDAALAGNTAAMEHYARHCLISHLNDSAKYWLTRCTEMPDSTPQAKKMLLRLRLGLKHTAHYLRRDAAPLTTSQKIRRVLAAVFRVIWRLIILASLVAIVVICVLMYKSNFDLGVFRDLPGAFAQYFG